MFAKQHNTIKKLYEEAYTNWMISKATFLGIQAENCQRAKMMTSQLQISERCNLFHESKMLLYCKKLSLHKTKVKESNNNSKIQQVLMIAAPKRHQIEITILEVSVKSFTKRYPTRYHTKCSNNTVTITKYQG